MSTNRAAADMPVNLTVPPSRLVEIRAAQRTFEGAYMRTALGQFSFALIILKIFTSEFYAIGALFAVYGAAVMLVAIYRRYEGHRQFFTSTTPDNDASSTSSDERRRNPNDNVRDVVGEGYDEPLPRKKFRTSGNSVALLAALSLAAYITLLVLTWRLVN